MAAGIHQLDVLHIGIAGLPVVIAEDGIVGIFFYIVPVASIQIIGPIHLNVQIAGLNDVCSGCHAIGKPCECRTDEHRNAQQ